MVLLGTVFLRLPLFLVVVLSVFPKECSSLLVPHRQNNHRKQYSPRCSFFVAVARHRRPLWKKNKRPFSVSSRNNGDDDDDSNGDNVLLPSDNNNDDNNDNKAVHDDDDNNNKKKNKKKYHWTRANLNIAIPALIGMLADPLLSLIDTAYVSRLGSIELAALGACTSIFHLSFSVFRATTTATTSLVASALQQKQQPQKEQLAANNGDNNDNNDNKIIMARKNSSEQVKDVITISLQFGLFLGCLLLLFLQVLSLWCLNRMGIPCPPPPPVVSSAAASASVSSSSFAMYKPAHQYLTTRAWAAPMVVGITVAEGAFRGFGDTRIPLLATVMASIINIVLDPILMFMAPFRWRIKGAAAATAISQIGAAMIYGIFLLKRNMVAVRARRRNNTTNNTDSNNNNGTNQRQTQTQTQTQKTTTKKGEIIRTILGANGAMFIKQGSLLFGWAYATAKATRIGPNHVAAHQIALSCWLMSALILDGPAVSAQVLMSRSIAAAAANNNNKAAATTTTAAAAEGSSGKSSNNNDNSPRNSSKSSSGNNNNPTKQQQQQRPPTKKRLFGGGRRRQRRPILLLSEETRSLIRYMMKFALVQGLVVCVLWFTVLARAIPPLFTTGANTADNSMIRQHLVGLMPIVAWHQLLVSLTLVMESLAIGANQFKIMSIGTVLATLWSIYEIRLPSTNTIQLIWSKGIVALFVGRLLTATVGVARIVL